MNIKTVAPFSYYLLFSISSSSSIACITTITIIAMQVVNFQSGALVPLTFKVHCTLTIVLCVWNHRVILYWQPLGIYVVRFLTHLLPHGISHCGVFKGCKLFPWGMENTTGQSYNFEIYYKKSKISTLTSGTSGAPWCIIPHFKADIRH